MQRYLLKYKMKINYLFRKKSCHSFFLKNQILEMNRQMYIDSISFGYNIRKSRPYACYSCV